MSSRFEMTPPVGLNFNGRPIGERSLTCDHCNTRFYQRENADVILMNSGNYDCCMVCFNYTGPGCIAPGVKDGLRRTTVAERMPVAEGPAMDQQAAMSAIMHFLTAGAREAPMDQFVPVHSEPDGDDGRVLVDMQIAPGAPAEFLAMMEQRHGPLAPVGRPVRAEPPQVATGVPVAATTQAPPAGPRRGPEGGRICTCLHCGEEYEEFTRTLQMYCSSACRNAPRTRHPMYGPESDDEP